MRVECTAGRPSAVDDRVMLTTAGREYCRRSNDAHGRTPGGDRVMPTAARRECCTQGDAHGRRLGVCRRSSHRAPAAARAGTGGVRHFPARFSGFCAPAFRERRGAAFFTSQHPVQNIVVSFRRPKHLFHRSPKHYPVGSPARKLFCSVCTITLESAAERARELGTDTHFFLAPAAPLDL